MYVDKTRIYNCFTCMFGEPNSADFCAEIYTQNLLCRCKQESLANAKVARDSLARQKTDFDVKLALKVILGHLFCNQLQADKG